MQALLMSGQLDIVNKEVEVRKQTPRILHLWCFPASDLSMGVVHGVAMV